MKYSLYLLLFVSIFLIGCDIQPEEVASDISESADGIIKELEPTESDPSEPNGEVDQIVDLLRIHPDIPSGQIDVAVNYIDEDHASGIVTHSRDDLVPPINWWAENIDDQWQIIAMDSDEAIECEFLEERGFPQVALGWCI